MQTKKRGSASEKNRSVFGTGSRLLCPWLLGMLLLGACEQTDAPEPLIAEEGDTDGGFAADLALRPIAICPEHMALVAVPETRSSVCVDRYEAAVERLRPDGTSEPWPFDRVVDGLTVRAIIRPGQKPQAYISGTQAQAACKLAGKRLCTQPEWLAACQGRSRFTYPYGNTYKKGACNEGRSTNPVHDCFGPGGGVFTSQNMNDPCCVSLPNTVAPAGSFPECKSSDHVYDLHGNLHEWVDDADGTFRGGFYADAEINGPGCTYVTTAHTVTYHDYSTGFRCCADREG